MARDPPADDRPGRQPDLRRDVHRGRRRPAPLLEQPQARGLPRPAIPSATITAPRVPTVCSHSRSASGSGHRISAHIDAMGGRTGRSRGRPQAPSRRDRFARASATAGSPRSVPQRNSWASRRSRRRFARVSASLSLSRDLDTRVGGLASANRMISAPIRLWRALAIALARRAQSVDGGRVVPCLL